jgi:hypothetical protein
MYEILLKLKPTCRSTNLPQLGREQASSPCLREGLHEIKQRFPPLRTIRKLEDEMRDWINHDPFYSRGKGAILDNLQKANQ